MLREMTQILADFDFRPHPAGFQATASFPNGWGVSIIPERGMSTYEVAVLRDGKISYESGLTDDVFRHLSVDAVHRVVMRARNLKAAIAVS